MGQIEKDHIISINAIKLGTDVSSILPLFAQEPDLACLPIIDHENIPLGIVREKDFKQFAYSMYGRDLIRKKELSDFLLSCPAIEITSDEDELLGRAGVETVHLGIIVTQHGKYHGFIDNRGLLAIYEKNRIARQQELIHAQRLESLGTLAGGIAHELNNLLVPIVGYTERLLRQAGDGDSSRQYLQSIFSASERAKDLVKQMLSFSNKGPQLKESISVTSLVREVQKLISVGISKKIEIRTAFDAVSDLVEGNATQLHQVLVNLCSNAVKAIDPESGVIDIRVDMVSLSASIHPLPNLPSGDYIRLSVCDTGCGIPADIIDKIFEPFFTTRRNTQGTGLGLSVVHGIVKAHAGAVTVESSVSEGSKFRVYLPKDPERQILTASPNIDPQQGAANILVVDDNRDVTGVWSMILEDFGYKVAAFNDSMEVLEMVQKGPLEYDLLITDQIMPNLSGSELACQVLKTNPKLPIILCTGFGDAITETRSAELGIKKYLLKPLTSKQLINAVQDLLTGNV